MSRSGNTYVLPAANSWVYPSAGNAIDPVDWKLLIDDIRDALTQSLRNDGGGSMQGQFKAVDGSVSTPGISFANETGSGWYRNASQDFRFSLGGVDRLVVGVYYIQTKDSYGWANVGRVAYGGILRTSFTQALATATPEILEINNNVLSVAYLVTQDTASYRLIATQPGTYAVGIDLTGVTSSAPVTLTTNLRVNGSVAAPGCVHTTTVGSSDYKNISLFNLYATSVVNETFEVWVEATANTTLTIGQARLIAYRVS